METTETALPRPVGGDCGVARGPRPPHVAKAALRAPVARNQSSGSRTLIADDAEASGANYSRSGIIADDAAPSKGALRQRAWRARKAAGSVVVTVVLPETIAAVLVSGGFLSPLAEDDPTAIRKALEAMLNRAVAREIGP